MPGMGISVKLFTVTGQATEHKKMPTKPSAQDYENTFPDTGCSDAQKQERAERRAFKAERINHGRTGRNRGIVVPDLPWQRTNERGISDGKS